MRKEPLDRVELAVDSETQHPSEPVGPLSHAAVTGKTGIVHLSHKIVIREVAGHCEDVRCLSFDSDVQRLHTLPQ
jgi:hypothetical protein